MPRPRTEAKHEVAAKTKRARTGNRGRGKTSTVDSVRHCKVAGNYVGAAILALGAKTVAALG
jgi:hypothetical protein